MKAGVYYIYGHNTEQTNEVVLCSAGFQSDGLEAFYVMNESKATATVYFSRASFNAKIKSEEIRPKYKKGQGSPAK